MAPPSRPFARHSWSSTRLFCGLSWSDATSPKASSSTSMLRATSPLPTLELRTTTTRPMRRRRRGRAPRRRGRCRFPCPRRRSLAHPERRWRAPGRWACSRARTGCRPEAGRRALDGELRRRRVRVRGLAEIADAAVARGAEQAGAGGNESLHIGGAGLRDVARAVEVVVQGDDGAPAPGVGIGGHRHRVEEVQRTVGAQGGGGAHGARQHHRALGLDHEMQEVSGLLGGVRAMGDDDAVCLIRGEQCVDPCSELQPQRSRSCPGCRLGRAVRPSVRPHSAVRVRHPAGH